MQLTGPSIRDGLSAAGSYQSLAILASYLLLALALTTQICVTLLTRARVSKNSTRRIEWAKVTVFGFLAIASLGATWYHMFAFFAYSYHDWACRVGSRIEDAAVTLPRLEMWLRETKLFKEAWGAVVATPQRYWWSGQIFFWATAWSLFLGIMGRKYKIPYTWAYMLLGQIVAISFAQQLFYLAILFSRPHLDAQSSAWRPKLYLEFGPVFVSIASSIFAPYAEKTSHFLFVLLIPHLLLFIPACIKPPQQKPGKADGTFKTSCRMTTKRYISLFSWIFAIVLTLQVGVTYVALDDASPVPLRRARDSCALEPAHTYTQKPWLRLRDTIFEHPAVSSVSWDVVFCAVGFLSWTAVHNVRASEMLGDVDSDLSNFKEKSNE